MLQNILKSWKRNHGNLLLTIGVVAALIMSLVWYFNILPDVEFVPDSTLSTQLPAGTNKTTPVFILVSGPVSPLGQQRRPSGIIQVHASDGNLDADTQPIQQWEFTLDHAGFATIGLMPPRSGSLAIVVFLDRNENGVLDYNSSGRPTEPLRITPDTTKPPVSLELDDAAIDLSNTGPIHFRFARSSP